jgi:hypothetical protein
MVFKILWSHPHKFRINSFTILKYLKKWNHQLLIKSNTCPTLIWFSFSSFSASFVMTLTWVCNQLSREIIKCLSYYERNWMFPSEIEPNKTLTFNVIGIKWKHIFIWRGCAWRSKGNTPKTFKCILISMTSHKCVAHFEAVW